MTSNNNLRAVIMAALMVMSVFAGTIALTGTAAAVGNEDVNYEGGAVHYVDSSGEYDSGDVPVIEVPTNKTADSVVLGTNVKVYDDDEEVDYTGWSTQADAETGSLIIVAPEVVSSEDITVELVEGETVNGAEGEWANPDEYDVTFASKTVDMTSVAADSDTPAFQGANVALKGAAESSLQIENGDSYFKSGSVGDGSEVYVWDTSSVDTDEYEVTYDDGTQKNFNITVRDLGLDLSIDDLNVTSDDTIEGTVSAASNNRAVELELLDSDGDEVNNTTVTLNSQGDADFEFSADESAGDYTVEARDTGTGVTVESDTITITKAGDDTASFSPNVIEDQRGDVVALTINQNSQYSTVTIGSEDQGYLANVTVEDGNDDGEVVLYWDTSQSNVNFTESGSATVDDVFSVEDGDDEVTSGDISDATSDLIDAGDYDLEIRAGQDASDDSQNVGTVVLGEASVNNVRSWTAPANQDIADLDDASEALENGNLTQDDQIAFGDQVIVQVEASGLEGFVEAQDEENPSFFDADGYGDAYRLTINQTNPGPNQDPKLIDVDSSDVSVIADGDNDTYFVAFDSDSVSAVFDENDDGIVDATEEPAELEDDDEFTAEFKMVEEDDVSSSSLALVEEESAANASFGYVTAEHMFDSDPINVTNAEGQVITGSSTVAPGSEVTVRVKSNGDTQPRFLKTTSVVVSENGTISAEFDFSEQNVGDTFEGTISGAAVSDSDNEAEADGNVVESTDTETTTEETTTEETTTEETTTEETTTEETTTEETTTEETTEETTTESSTPGFGIAVALVALVAAALLAVRRD